jgi:type I restriction enzyme S subunit
LFAPYLNYLLSSRPLQDKIFAGEDGVSREGLTFDRIGNFTLAIPAAIAQQQEICVFLDRETGRITAAIEKKERLVTLLEEKRTALINGAVTRGLGPAVAMRDSGSHLLGMIPRHWEVKRLLYFTHPARPVMYGIVLPGPNVADGVPIVKGGDVAPGRLRLDLLNRTTREIESSYARSRLRGGDIVYAIRGSIGSAELVPPELCGANLTQDAARISPSTGVDGRWLLYALKAHCTFAQVDCGAMGATIRGVNIRDLKRVILPVPPLHEQSAIVEYLSLATTALDKAIAKILEQISKLQEYRTALISAAVTGKIDLRGSAET